MRKILFLEKNVEGTPQLPRCKDSPNTFVSSISDMRVEGIRMAWQSGDIRLDEVIGKKVRFSRAV
jgi:hypothetical protein